METPALPLSAKKREIIAREQKILNVARPMLVRGGYAALSMERIAEGVEYSRGTIYNHFSCKEEIVVALAAQNAADRVTLFRMAAEFPGDSRSRMLAVCYAHERFAADYPDNFLFEQIFTLDSVREKTSPERQQLIYDCERECMSIVAGVVRDAVASGDLVLGPNATAERLVFGLWSLTSGAYSIAFTSKALPQMGIEDPFLITRDHINALLDGYQWQPLSLKQPTKSVMTQIHTELKKLLATKSVTHG